MGKKKEVVEIFPTFARLRNIDPSDEVLPEDMRPGEFRDTAVFFAPSQQRGECGLTIRFRCTAKIVRGDTVTIRLPGFKGRASVFALESRPHPDNQTFNHNFQAYYSGEDGPKGVAPQTIILKCRAAVEENALVILGVPEAVHVVLPEKLPANSTKLKIEGAIRHVENGKIVKAPVMESSEVRKRSVEDDIAELEEIIREFVGTEKEPGVLKDNDMDIIQEITLPEADTILETARDRRELAVGLSWRIETDVFQDYETSCQFIAQTLRETYREEVSHVPMALHKELARNFGIKLAAVIVLEDALYTMHGAYYPELARSAVMVLRLYTMEAHDLSHLLEVFNSPCMHREIHSSMRTKNATLLKKWVNSIAALTTCTSKLTHVSPELIPILYSGIRDVSSDMLHHFHSLQKGDWYVINDFMSCSTDINVNDESFSPPDNAVLFEIHKVIDAVEVGDCSQYPEDRLWLLPMMASYAVVGIEVFPDKNNMTKVVLEMRGGLGSVLRDDRFPEEERVETSAGFFKRAKAVAEPIAQRTAAIAKCIYANLRLRERKELHPQYLLHSKYLAQFAETQRNSCARQTLEDGSCKWLVCTCEEQVADGIVKPATWEVLAKKFAITVEASFLNRTRAKKQFQFEGIAVDFATRTVDYGKGLMRIRRVVGKMDNFPFQPI